MCTPINSPALRPAVPPNSPATGCAAPAPAWFAETILELAAQLADAHPHSEAAQLADAHPHSRLRGAWRNGPPKIVTGRTTVERKTSTAAEPLMPRKALSGSATPCVTPRSQIGTSSTPQGTPDPKRGPLGEKTVRTLHGAPAGVHLADLTSAWATGNE